MKLNRLTPRQVFNIKTPVWGGGKRVVGIDKSLIKKHNQINISYVRKDGRKSFPDPYYFDGDRIGEGFDTKVVGGGVELLLIPLGELEILEIESPPAPTKVRYVYIKELKDIKRDYPNIYEIFFNKQERLL